MRTLYDLRPRLRNLNSILRLCIYTLDTATVNIGVILVIIVSISANSAFAGGARSDWSDHYDSVPGAPQCWQDGYDDGQNGPFDQGRHEECIFDIPQDVTSFNEPYYEAFIYGCIDGGNTKETCETFTDS